jgi:hypothetical protein
MASSSNFDVRPVTSAESGAFQAPFSAKGCPGFCWCTPSRFKDAQNMDRHQKRDAMLELIKEGTPVGVLAFDGDEPVGKTAQSTDSRSRQRRGLGLSGGTDAQQIAQIERGTV